MKFTIIGSGSNGNCNIIETKNTTIVIDCGCSVTYTKKCFEEIGVDIEKVDAVLITHEHTDHIKSIRMFSNTLVYSPILIAYMKNQVQVNPYQIIQIKDLTILPIILSHDSNICVGYIVSDGSETLVQVTDTGYLSETNQKLIKGANYYIFESNHDPEMLMNAHRPDYVKKRILSDNGHMSNEYSSEMLATVVNEKTSDIVLAHISEEANSYDLSYNTLVQTFQKHGIDSSKFKLKAIKQFEVYSSGKIN